MADGRGGHVALWARSSSTGRQLFLGRATLNGPLRARLIRRDIQGQLRFSDPAVAGDRWIVVAWGQSEIGSRAGYVTTRSPRGRVVTSEIRGVSIEDGDGGYVAPFYSTVLTANRRDPARVVFGRTDISPGRVSRLVLESRLR